MPEHQVSECLNYLGISSLGDWDVLVFLYRHQASLASAEQIGRLLGYARKAVGDSLERLESHRLVQRSRSSQGVRLYELALSEAILAPDSCFRLLIGLTGNRAGRLSLIKHLRNSVGSHLAAKGKLIERKEFD